MKPILLLSSLLLLTIVSTTTSQYVPNLEPFNYDQLQAIGDHSASYRPFGWQAGDSMVAPPGIDERDTIPTAAFPFKAPALPTDFQQQQQQMQSSPGFAETQSYTYLPQQQQQMNANDMMNDGTMPAGTLLGMAQSTVPIPSSYSNDNADPQQQEAVSEPATPLGDDLPSNSDDSEPRFATPTQQTSSSTTTPAERPTPITQTTATPVTTTQQNNNNNNAISPATQLGTPPQIQLPAAVTQTPTSQSTTTTQTTTTQSTTKKRKKRLHPCVPNGDGQCKVRFNGKLKWKTLTVPTGSLKLDDPNNSQQQQSPNSIPQPKYSDIPEVAAAQKRLYDNQKEILTEKNWVQTVKQTITDYQSKMRRVQSHISALQNKIRRQQRKVTNLIKKDKQKKLAQELQVAMAALNNLEQTSSQLSQKIGVLSQTRFNLHGTIQRIKNSLGQKLSSLGVQSNDQQQQSTQTQAQTFNVPMRFRETSLTDDSNGHSAAAAQSLLNSLAQFLRQAQAKTVHHSHKLAPSQIEETSSTTEADSEQQQQVDEDVSSPHYKSAKRVAREIELAEMHRQAEQDENDAKKIDLLMKKYGAKPTI